jgi:acyl carrier protein
MTPVTTPTRAPSTPGAPGTETWTVPVLKQLALELLADYLSTTPAELAKELAARGAGMPVDSLDLFDVLPDFWRRTGLKVPTKKLTRATMRSIDAFANYVATWCEK